MEHSGFIDFSVSMTFGVKTHTVKHFEEGKALKGTSSPTINKNNLKQQEICVYFSHV